MTVLLLEDEVPVVKDLGAVPVEEIAPEDEVVGHWEAVMGNRNK